MSRSQTNFPRVRRRLGSYGRFCSFPLGIDFFKTYHPSSLDSLSISFQVS